MCLYINILEIFFKLGITLDGVWLIAPVPNQQTGPCSFCRGRHNLAGVTSPQHERKAKLLQTGG